MARKRKAKSCEKGHAKPLCRTGTKSAGRAKENAVDTSNGKIRCRRPPRNRTPSGNGWSQSNPIANASQAEPPPKRRRFRRSLCSRVSGSEDSLSLGGDRTSTQKSTTRFDTEPAEYTSFTQDAHINDSVTTYPIVMVENQSTSTTQLNVMLQRLDPHEINAQISKRTLMKKTDVHDIPSATPSNLIQRIELTPHISCVDQTSSKTEFKTVRTSDSKSANKSDTSFLTQPSSSISVCNSPGSKNSRINHDSTNYQELATHSRHSNSAKINYEAKTNNIPENISPLNLSTKNSTIGTFNEENNTPVLCASPIEMLHADKNTSRQHSNTSCFSNKMNISETSFSERSSRCSHYITWDDKSASSVEEGTSGKTDEKMNRKAALESTIKASATCGSPGELPDDIPREATLSGKAEMQLRALNEPPAATAEMYDRALRVAEDVLDWSYGEDGRPPPVQALWMAAGALDGQGGPRPRPCASPDSHSSEDSFLSARSDWDATAVHRATANYEGMDETTKPSFHLVQVEGAQRAEGLRDAKVTQLREEGQVHFRPEVVYAPFGERGGGSGSTRRSLELHPQKLMRYLDVLRKSPREDDRLLAARLRAAERERRAEQRAQQRARERAEREWRLRMRRGLPPPPPPPPPPQPTPPVYDPYGGGAGGGGVPGPGKPFYPGADPGEPRRRPRRRRPHHGRRRRVTFSPWVCELGGEETRDAVAAATAAVAAASTAPEETPSASGEPTDSSRDQP